MTNDSCPTCGETADHGAEACPRIEARLARGALIAGQYRVLERIGEGAVGVVYRGRQESVGREVAIKVLRDCHKAHAIIIRRFQNEAKAISQLRHPNTVRLIDFQESEGDLFIITELLRGVSLRTVLEKGPIPIERALRIAEEIAASLGEAHALGIVHRDLKPENIFLDRVGSDDVVKVLDFGIAKLHDPNGTPTLQDIVVGTPTYMAPEQARADAIDGRCDLYALGVMLFEMLRGRPPFDGDTAVSVLVQHITDDPPPLSDPANGLVFPPEVEALVSSLLEKRREARPPDAEALRERLRAMREGSRAGVQTFRRRPRRAVLALGTAVGLGTVALALLAARGSNDAPSSAPVVVSAPALSVPSPPASAPSLAVPSSSPVGTAPSTMAGAITPPPAPTPPAVAADPEPETERPRLRDPRLSKMRRKPAKATARRPAPRFPDGPLPVEIE